ncbi:MAG: hypothetical protein A3B90_01655 [Candidatus Magasanikbacteria bacterium RIFCSPHIGHO2_02_FULL_41_13]|uniref:L,D-TPase catalytic domain-containing protein n=1 Tax=Candidatus Magasanikbacteria bacterium RIFCSPHIGHO2_02_FULL_41_13 TaxID=1798676 RepID=A0A1F6M6Y7_9BACT|nr:MAG: hypothetical protein A3B90_01655 [Candidatus Magasanikbacteria bacterium RIFCSPHIGHO2_02_FULL_41_13]
MTFLKTTNKIAFLVIVLAFCFFAIPKAHAADLAGVLDSDHDGLTDTEETTLYATDPNNADTDGDSFLDGREVDSGYSPHKGNSARMSQNDFDADGLNDAIEVTFHASLGNVDTDADGYSDYDEVMSGYDPASATTNLRLSRAVIVDRSTQRVSYRVNGIEMKNFPVSTGNPFTPTPAGEFSVQRKREYVDYIGVGYSYPHIRWNLQFLPHYYLHTATWHNDFGKRTRSHGCVNMREADAAFLFKYLDVGVPVTVTGTTPIHLYVASK